MKMWNAKKRGLKEDWLNRIDLSKVKDELLKRGAHANGCMACGNEQLSLMEGYLKHAIYTGLPENKSVIQSIPSTVLICLNCGFMMQHALGIFRPSMWSGKSYVYVKEKDD